jgi:hypothetical protein
VTEQPTWKVLDSPDFWARHFAEVEDVLSMEPPAPHGARFARSQQPHERKRNPWGLVDLRCFWLDGHREWLVECYKMRYPTRYKGSGSVWVVQLYELDVVEHYLMQGGAVVELYWKRQRYVEKVPRIAELVKQAVMLEALK